MRVLRCWRAWTTERESSFEEKYTGTQYTYALSVSVSVAMSSVTARTNFLPPRKPIPVRTDGLHVTTTDCPRIELTAQ